MNNVKFAWDAFTRVLAEITEENRRGASLDVINELFQHARELLEILDEEIAEEPSQSRVDMRNALAMLRAKLVALEKNLKPLSH